MQENDPFYPSLTYLEECKDFVNENASPAIQQAIVFDPPADGDATWQPVDDKTIKNFVHSFFNKQ